MLRQSAVRIPMVYLVAIAHRNISRVGYLQNNGVYTSLCVNQWIIIGQLCA